MRWFSFSKNKRVALYGVNMKSISALEGLKSKGYHVDCFIDRNPDCLKDVPIPIMDIEGFAQIMDKKTIIVICLQNGNIHEVVANQLKEKGYRNILYLPMGNKRSIFECRKLREAFFFFMNGEFNYIKNIPQYESSERKFRIICETDENISFYCPIKYVYSSSIEFEQQNGVKHVNRLFAKKYSDKPISQFEPYFNLYKWISSPKSKYPELYLEYRESYAEINRNKYLEDRRALFSQYENAIKTDKAFFEDSPSQCFYVDGKIYLFDGMHRACFLVYKKEEEIPINLKKCEYLRFEGNIESF